MVNGPTRFALTFLMVAGVAIGLFGITFLGGQLLMYVVTTFGPIAGWGLIFFIILLLVTSFVYYSLDL